jgi:hypothetical protein
MANYLQNYFIEDEDNLSWIEQNLFKVYPTSLKYSNLCRLQLQCEKFIKQNPKLIFEPENFHNLEKICLLNLIKLDDLPLQEVEIWRYLIKWGFEQDPIIINKNVEKWGPSDIIEFESRMRDFIPHIRFFTISSELYHGDVRPYKEIIPPRTIEQLEKFYFVRGSHPPPDALPRRTPSIPPKRKKSNVNLKKEPPCEIVPEESINNSGESTANTVEESNNKPEDTVEESNNKPDTVGESNNNTDTIIGRGTVI